MSNVAWASVADVRSAWNSTHWWRWAPVKSTLAVCVWRKLVRSSFAPANTAPVTLESMNAASTSDVSAKLAKVSDDSVQLVASIRAPTSDALVNEHR